MNWLAGYPNPAADFTPWNGTERPTRHGELFILTRPRGQFRCPPLHPPSNVDVIPREVPKPHLFDWEVDD